MIMTRWSKEDTFPHLDGDYCIQKASCHNLLLKMVIGGDESSKLVLYWELQRPFPNHSLRADHGSERDCG